MVKLTTRLLSTLAYEALKSVGARNVVLATRLSGRTLRFLVPLRWMPRLLDNFEHVMLDGDYFAVPWAVPRGGWIVADVGASVGFYAVAAEALAKRMALGVAIEPNPDALGYLKANVEANCRSRMLTLPLAVCPKGGTVRLYVAAYGPVSSLLREHVERYSEVEKVVEARCIRLGTLARVFGPLDMVKLDVEGLEYEVLRSSADELGRVRRLVVEVHEHTSDRGDVAGILEAFGFEVVIYRPYEAQEQCVVFAFRPEGKGVNDVTRTVPKSPSLICQGIK